MLSGGPGLRSALVGLLPPPVRTALARARARVERRAFERGGRRPWSAGYLAHRELTLRRAFDDGAVRTALTTGAPLPRGHGVGVDERAVELPWILAHLGDSPGQVLDAGSALNHEVVLERRELRAKVLHIYTLAPEANCFHERGISYCFGDLRDLSLRAGYFDVVACVSTLEHVGFDNTRFTGAERHREGRQDDFVVAMGELGRVLKPGGALLLTVPYGRYERFPGFQQFDAALLDRAVAAFGPSARVDTELFRYGASGWQRALAAECADCRYVGWLGEGKRGPDQGARAEPDGAAAARALACVRLVKA